MAKKYADKYYTPQVLADYCIEKTKEVIGVDNISSWIEPSAGNGRFSLRLDGCIAYDIAPGHNSIIRGNFLDVVLPYKKGRCIIGNPPFGAKGATLLIKFFKKSIEIGDYVAWVLPISQYNNKSTLYEFDLIHSEKLPKAKYSDVELDCCFNIYKRPTRGLNSKPKVELLKDVEIVRMFEKEKKESDIDEYDIVFCKWGTIGKISSKNKRYASEFGIKVKNKAIRGKVLYFIQTYDWSKLCSTGTACLTQHKLISILKENIEGIK